MGLFSKRKKGRKYESEEAHDDPDPDRHKRKDPYLIIGDAPPRPYFAGKGLESNNVYNISREDENGQDWSDANDHGASVPQAKAKQAGPAANAAPGAKEKPAAKGDHSASAAKPVTEQQKQAASAPTAAPPGPVTPIVPERPGRVVHALKLVQAALVAYVLLLALFIKWLHPRPGAMAGAMLAGFALGVGYSFLHHANRARKERLAALVRLPCPAPCEGSSG